MAKSFLSMEKQALISLEQGNTLKMEYFLLELWFDTSYFPELDANISNEFCNSFCQLTKQNILGLCIVAEIKFFAMGTEMCVDYSERLDESIKKVTMLCAIGVRKPAGTKEQLP